MDANNHRVVRIDDVTGTGFVSFGTYGTWSGELGDPDAVAVDANGRIYVADHGNSRVVCLDDISGTRFTEYGGSAGDAFNRVSGVVIH